MEQIQLTQLSLDEFKGFLLDAILELYRQIENNNPDQLLTRKELASKLNISLPTLHKYSENGTISAYKIGERIYYRWSDVLNSAIMIVPKKQNP